MGTRADFYVQYAEGGALTWIGSIAWDGNVDGIRSSFDDVCPGVPMFFDCRDASACRWSLMSFLAHRDDATQAHEAWPWPWESSSLTDCAYVLRAWRPWGAQLGFWDAYEYGEPRWGGVPEQSWPAMAPALSLS